MKRHKHPTRYGGALTQSNTYIALLRYSPRPSVNVDEDGSPESFKGQLARINALIEARRGELLAVREEPAVSGTKKSRKVLEAVLEECRRTGATLIVSTLDRLSRRVAFVSALMESGVPFVAADSPNDGELVVNIKTAVAQEESKRVSQRTRDAMCSMQRGGRVVSKEPPFGWRRGRSFESRRFNRSIRVSYMMEPDAEEQETLRRIRELRAEVDAGRLTVYGACKVLEAEGRKPRAGAWSSNKLTRIWARDDEAGGVFAPDTTSE